MTGGVRTRERPVPSSVPEVVDTRRARLVYEAVARTGPAQTDDLAADLGMAERSLMPVLSTLTRRDVVARTDEGYVVRLP